MMVGIVSDVHANASALKAVLADASVEQWLCCGDLVGYYEQANECVDLIRLKKVVCVKGNHDDAFIKNDFTRMRRLAVDVLKKTRLSKENFEFLKALPQEKRVELNGVRFLVLHGKPGDLWAYVYPKDDLSDFFKQDADVIAFGQTHYQTLAREAGKTVLNPGSVGQPRDGDPRASYAVFDTKKNDIEFKRASYR